MSDEQVTFDWQLALTQTFEGFSQQLIDRIPQLLGAITLLVLGWFMAWLLRLLTRKVIRVLDVLFIKAAHSQGGQQSPFRSYANLGGDIVFWIVILFFLAAITHLMEWEVFAGVTNVLLTYLPNVLSGLLIIFAGFGLSGIARSAVSSTADSMGFQQGDLVSRIAQMTVVLTAIVIGLEQFGINVAFISTTLVVVAGVLLAGVALAFGLGAQQLIANVIGAQTTRKHYQVGQLIKVGSIEGYLLEITATSIILDTDTGRAAIPAKIFHEQVSEFIDDTGEPMSTSLAELLNVKGDHDGPN